MMEPEILEIELDRHIAEQSQQPGLQNNTVLSHAATTIRDIGEPGSIVLAGATYIYGRAQDSPASAELGLRTIESIGAAGITTYIIKGFAGRARPFVTSDTNSHDFKFARGFRQDDYTSFPSGHVTIAFAAASTASEEISYLWPHASHLGSRSSPSLPPVQNGLFQGETSGLARCASRTVSVISSRELRTTSSRGTERSLPHRSAGRSRCSCSRRTACPRRTRCRR